MSFPRLRIKGRDSSYLGHCSRSHHPHTLEPYPISNVYQMGYVTMCTSLAVPTQFPIRCQIRIVMLNYTKNKILVSFTFPSGGTGLIYSASQDCTIKVWKAETGALMNTLQCHGHWVNVLALNTDYALRTGAFDPCKPRQVGDKGSLSHGNHF